MENGTRSAGRLPVLDVICDVLKLDVTVLIGEDPHRETEVCIGNSEVEQIQSSLEQYRFDSDGDPSISREVLKRQVAYAWSAFEAADYRCVSAALPSLLEDGQEGFRSSQSRRRQTQVHTEAEQALYGHVLLQAAVAAGAEGDTAAVRDLTAEASTAASFVAPGSNHYRLSFNATNVKLHEISALVALGEGGRAVEAAQALDPAATVMLRRERRAALLVDIARANSQIGRRDEALRNLLDAESVAPKEVACRPVAQSTVADLLRRSGAQAPQQHLTQLAKRCGVTEYER